MPDNQTSITQLLDRWKTGDHSVRDRLIERIYPVIRAQAQTQIERMSGHDLTLCATELAHEAYERLSRQQEVDWDSRNHFFAFSATILRRVLVDYIRHQSAAKRGRQARHIPHQHLHSDQIPGSSDGLDLMMLDQTLDALAESDPELFRVVELRIFSGLSIQQIAEICKTSTATVGRRWRFAKAWLAKQLEVGKDG